MTGVFRRARAEFLESRNLLAADVSAVAEVVASSETAELDFCSAIDLDNQRVSVTYEKFRAKPNDNVWLGDGNFDGHAVEIETIITEAPVPAGAVFKVANFQFKVKFSDDCYVVATLEGHVNLQNGRITLNGTVTESTMPSIAEGARVHLQSIVSPTGEGELFDPLGQVNGTITFNSQTS